MFLADIAPLSICDDCISTIGEHLSSESCFFFPGKHVIVNHETPLPLRAHDRTSDANYQ